MSLSHWPQQRRDSTPDSFSAECICRTRVNFHFPIQCPIQHTMSLSLSHETTSKESLARQNAFAQKPTGSTFTLTANVKVRRFLAKNLIAKEFDEKTLKQRRRIWSTVLNSNFFSLMSVFLSDDLPTMHCSNLASWGICSQEKLVFLSQTSTLLDPVCLTRSILDWARPRV